MTSHPRANKDKLHIDDLSNRPTNAIQVLISVMNHYTDLLSSSASSTASPSTTPKPNNSSPNLNPGATSTAAPSAATKRTIRKDLSPKQITEIIRSNYDSLTIPSALDDKIGEWSPYREGLPDEKVFVKKMVNAIVGGDVRTRVAFLPL